MSTIKEIILKYSNINIFEKTPNSLISFLERTVFNKPVIDKNSDYTALGGNAIKDRIFNAKKYNDIHLKDNAGLKITKNKFLNLLNNTHQEMLNVINKYLENYNENGELII